MRFHILSVEVNCSLNFLRPYFWAAWEDLCQKLFYVRNDCVVRRAGFLQWDLGRFDISFLNEHDSQWDPRDS